MFHLTPAERAAVLFFCCVLVLGGLVHYGLNCDARPLRWVTSASQPIARSLPDINVSPPKELERIDGIGPATAKRIVDYRNEHGPFVRLDELTRVRGISRKTVEKIEAYYRQNAHE